MKPRIWIGIIAGFIGLAITLIIFFSVQGIDNIFWGLGTNALVFFIGCITAGYFAAKQENIATKVAGEIVGAWAGFIAGFIMTFLSISFIFSFLEYIFYVDSSNPGFIQHALFVYGSSTFVSIFPAIIGALLGIVGSSMMSPSLPLEISPN